MGEEVETQCFNIASMVKAALHSTVIDFVSISTHGGELFVLSMIPRSVQIRVSF